MTTAIAIRAKLQWIGQYDDANPDTPRNLLIYLKGGQVLNVELGNGTEGLNEELIEMIDVSERPEAWAVNYFVPVDAIVAIAIRS
jgi:hypothetical protein